MSIMVKTEDGFGFSIDDFVANQKPWTAGRLLVDARIQLAMDDLTTIEIEFADSPLSEDDIVPDGTSLVVR